MVEAFHGGFQFIHPGEGRKARRVWWLGLQLPFYPEIPKPLSQPVDLKLPRGSMLVPFCGLYLGSYKVIPKRNYNGAYGYRVILASG